MTAETVNVTLALPVSALAVQAAPPVLVSQLTAEAVFGIPARTFREALPAYRACGGEVARLGKLRLVGRASFVAWLNRRREEAGPEPDGAAILAAELGLRPVAGGRP